MTLQNFFNQRQIDMIIEALTAQEKKWRDVAKRPIQGYGKATELAKKEERAMLADEYNELLRVIVDYTI